MLWGELLVEYEAALRAASVSDPGVSARHIVEEASGFYGSEWVLQESEPVTQNCLASADKMLERRKSGEPLQYVVGAWSFRELDILLDSRVLIPRPETEEVAGWAIDEVRRIIKISGNATVVDLGTGSGVIGLSVAYEEPFSKVYLTDASRDALTVARANAAGMGSAGTNVSLSEGSWFEALDLDLLGSVDVLVSNPPYCKQGDEFGEGVVEWEPESALFSGVTGLEDLSHLVSESPKWLRPNGALVLEMAPDQVQEVSAQAEQYFTQVESHTDLAGRPRCVVARELR